MEIGHIYLVKADVSIIFEGLYSIHVKSHKINLKEFYGEFITDNFGVFRKHVFRISKGKYIGMYVILGVNEYAAD
nr:MAG TPA: hypothetical protein [Caudoviricetes sp.]